MNKKWNYGCLTKCDSICIRDNIHQNMKLKIGSYNGCVLLIQIWRETQIYPVIIEAIIEANGRYSKNARPTFKILTWNGVVTSFYSSREYYYYYVSHMLFRVRIALMHGLDARILLPNSDYIFEQKGAWQ